MEREPFAGYSWFWRSQGKGVAGQWGLANYWEMELC